MLIFIVHDESLKSDDISLNKRGFFFGAPNEIRDLDPNEYGFCFANESFVRKAIQQATGRQDYGRVPRGLAAHQDIYVVAKGGKADFSKFVFDRGTNWSVDTLVVGARGISVSGWTVSMTEGILVDRIEMLFKDRLLAAAKP